MALPLPRAAVLLLLLLAAPLLCAAQGPISQPPSPGAPTASPKIHPDSAAAAADEDGASASSPTPSAHPPAQSPADDDGEKAASPPAPVETAPAPASSLHSVPAAPAPAPYTGADDDDDEKSPAPAPAPAAMEVKSGTGSGASDEQPRAVDAAENERREGMSGGKKAGVVVGVLSAAAVVGLAAVVYRKRQANIRRSRYADYSARLELV